MKWLLEYTYFLAKSLLYVSVEFCVDYLLIPVVFLSVIYVTIAPWFYLEDYFYDLGYKVGKFWSLKHLAFSVVFVASGSYAFHSLEVMYSSEFQDMLLQFKANFKDWLSIDIVPGREPILRENYKTEVDYIRDLEIREYSDKNGGGPYEPLKGAIVGLIIVFIIYCNKDK